MYLIIPEGRRVVKCLNVLKQYFPISQNFEKKTEYHEKLQELLELLEQVDHITKLNRFAGTRVSGHRRC